MVIPFYTCYLKNNIITEESLNEILKFKSFDKYYDCKYLVEVIHRDLFTIKFFSDPDGYTISDYIISTHHSNILHEYLYPYLSTDTFTYENIIIDQYIKEYAKISMEIKEKMYLMNMLYLCL